ncbi:hypothetical protein EVU91_02305 [Macrococcoides bohemicum]|uniref:hypothetical protein n=1 Tax=Macrococcoides bohemicum TaxID=1903056 RepID=UPI0010595BAA|nr:hypothetical protein [Macrococcus bohemicus]TDL40746.1 hypothetical protein EVU91_02305 [Macrococcus bohemicus]
MIIQPNSFQLLQQYPTHIQFNRCRKRNTPMCYAAKRVKQYTYIVIDWTTATWRLSPDGLRDLQYRLNWELYKLWNTSNFNLKSNQTMITENYTTLRLTDNLAQSLIDFLNTQCSNEHYWVEEPQTHEAYQQLLQEYDDKHLSGLGHRGSNNNKVFVMSESYKLHKQNLNKKYDKSINVITHESYPLIAQNTKNTITISVKGDTVREH